MILFQLLQNLQQIYLISRFAMKNLILFLIIVSIAHSHIYSSPPKVTYGYSGTPLYYSLFFALQTGIGSSDYLRINWPQNIHDSNKNEIVVNLISFSNNLQVATSTCINEATALTYFVTLGYTMTANTWYELQIYPTKAPTTMPVSHLIQMMAVSDFGSNNIIYDSNMAFGYVDILPLLSPQGNLGVIGNSSSSQATVPAAIYSFDIYLTPSVSSSSGGNFSISIYYDSAVPAHNTGTTIIDFSFMGLCQSAATDSASAAILIYCSISSDLSTITFAMSSVTAGQAVRITTSISNPVYYSVRGIKAYWTEFVSGRVMDNGLRNDALQVNQITINTVSPRVLLFWGIESTYTDGSITTALPVFSAASASPNILVYNSFNIGFSFTHTSPITGQYIVYMTLGATGVAEGSIAHNLPAYTGASVYCYYDTTNKYIVCKNVGAFINTNYRYFISGKAFFGFGTTSPITTFGAVSISPVAYTSSGTQILTPVLYDALGGESVNVQVSQQFLDLSGYHNTNSYSIGNAQVVSYNDDLNLNSTAVAVQSFLQGTNSSIGIIPDLGTSQQLLFLLNTPTSSIYSGGIASTNYTINLMFNSQVISFQTSAAGRGLDFVGYLTSTTAWSISGSPCYFSAIVCQKYNNATPSYNIKSIVSASAAGINFYGMYNFQCGTSYSPAPSPACASNCASECTMFTGYGLSNKGTSLMSMRQVVLPSGFHTSLYADTNVLDFLFMFKHNTTIISYCLINGFTMSGAKLQNIKAAYVNYYDNNVSPFHYNKGVRIPMMVRIGGGVLPAQSNGATAIGIFFDDNVDASTFYTSTGNSWDIGCSTGTCSYFQNQGLSNQRTDNWIVNRQVIVYNLPPIQNEFNILVPVTPATTNRNPPKYLTIAFFSQNYTVWGVSNLLQTVAVYRLFGPVVTSSVSGALTSINSLARTSSTPDSQMSANNFALSGGFGQYLNTTNMYSNINNNTFVASNSDAVNTFGSAYGAGYTITSFFYNIFASSTLSWSSPPANTATTCTVFGYVYNQKVSGNAYKNGQWMYVAFCPIDSTFVLTSSAANINFINPQYPLVFTNNYPLRGIMTIAYSSQFGALRAYRHETTAITTLLRNCTTAMLQKYNPTSPGKQRSTFTLTIPAITMSASGYEGYSSFRIIINIPSSTVSGATFSMQTGCQTTNTLLSCTASNIGATQVTVTFNYISTGTSTITYLQVNLYATAASTFSTAASYTVTVYLPQYISAISSYAPFGDTNYGSSTTYCQCQSSFIVGITPYGQSATFNALTFSSAQRNVRSKVSFNFGASSYRDAFFSTSTYLFSFGFLYTPCFTPYRQRSNFRCLIYEGQNTSSLKLSSAWKFLTLTNFASATLTPKAEISNPSSIIYQINCFGGGIPTATNTTDMTIAWRDGASNVQTASNIALSSLTLSTAPPTTATIAFNAKRFNTVGMKSLYSLRVSSPVSLTPAARFYFDFHMMLSPYLDQNGVVECYIRTTSTIDDGAAKYTYCAFSTWWQLMVWNNLEIIAAGTFFYVDIYNIDLPKSADITSNQLIMVTIDTDGDYSSGVAATAQMTDTAPTSTTPTDFYIISSLVTSNFILSTQTLTMDIDMLAANTAVFASGTASIYVLFPASYAVWNNRSQTIPVTYSSEMSRFCAFNRTGISTNLATSCTFISQRILKINLLSVTHQYFTLTLANINTPASIPSGKFNQYKFNLFIAGSSETIVTHYTFSDYSQYLTLATNPSLMSLSWNYYSLSVASSLFTLTPLKQVITVQQGYYSNVIQLRQSIYPNNFQATLQLTISDYSSDFLTISPLTVDLGKPTAYFRFAATGLTSAGLYILQFTKSGDTNNVYTNIPPLTLVVQNTLCSLTTDANTYTLPIGGQTLPIIINAIGCIPTSNISLGVTFSANGTGQFSVNTDLSNLLLTSSSVDGQLYIIIRHTTPSSGSLVAGNSVTATISITGSSSAFYAAIPAITLTLVDATTFQTFPTGTALSPPTLSGNKATIQLQCSQSSRIYWGIGLYPSILNNAQVDFQARIISAGTGLATNFTESNDYYGRVYGVLRGTTMQVISQTMYNLQSNVNYIFKYFCVNQLGHVSDSQSINFTTSNYGAYLMKVEITFRGSITYGQYNKLACSLAQNFIIPYTRVLTQAMSSCGNTPYILYNNDSSVVLNQADSNGWYIYGFYIEPDYTIANDQTNANIRNQLSLSTQATTIITSTANYITLPSLVQMQTTDIQIYTTPIMSISSPASGLTSVAVTALITNMNGFIVIGVMQGAFNSSTMTIPSASNLKSGKFSATQNLTAVQMIHTTQNYNTTFQFGGLSANTLYTFFYFCTVEDPAITALSSSVGTFSAQTLQMLVININYSPSLSFVWLLAFVLFALAF